MSIFSHESDGVQRSTVFEGRPISYVKCRHCGQVLFENEPNPYFNMACNKHAERFEDFRNQLKVK